MQAIHRFGFSVRDGGCVRSIGPCRIAGVLVALLLQLLDGLRMTKSSVSVCHLVWEMAQLAAHRLVTEFGVAVPQPLRCRL